MNKEEKKYVNELEKLLRIMLGVELFDEIVKNKEFK